MIKFVLMSNILYLYSMTPPFTMIGSSVAVVEESKHQDFPQGEKNSFRFFLTVYTAFQNWAQILRVIGTKVLGVSLRAFYSHLY